jgi:hypothetical protein
MKVRGFGAVAAIAALVVLSGCSSPRPGGHPALPEKRPARHAALPVRQPAALPTLPITTALERGTRTVIPGRLGSGDASIPYGGLKARVVVLQIACDGPGSVTVLQQTVGPCQDTGVLTVTIPWGHGDLAVSLRANSATHWAVYVGAR